MQKKARHMGTPFCSQDRIGNQVRGKQVTAVELRQALETISSDGHYREAAIEIQRDLRATGGYRQAADEIQAYIAAGTNSTPN